MQELLRGAGFVCLYFAVVATTLLVCRWRLSIPDELFRKMLHFVLLGSYIPFVFGFDTWWLAALCALALEALIYPALAWFERFKGYSSLTTERRKGELKQSLLLAFTMLAFCILVCWGLLKDRYLVLACMYAWGVGDAFAALVGKAYGKHRFRLKAAVPGKSVEGTCAMFVSSALTVAAVLLFRGGLRFPAVLITAVCGAAAAAVVELLTPNGMDTVTCPAAAMAVMVPVLALLGGLA